MSNLSPREAIAGLVFPGQGSQRDGMAQDFVREFQVAKEVFEEASEVLDLDLFGLCHGEDERLHLTEFAQPAILTAELAMLRVCREHLGLQGGYWAGHSLGEYTALVAAGAIPFDSALRLVRRRGKLMQQAVPVGVGSMLAVIQPNLELSTLSQVAHSHQLAMANINSPSQVVLSGAKESIEALLSELRPKVEAAGGRLVPLKVSAPFHSPWLEEIEPLFEESLRAESGRFEPGAARTVISNTLGGFHEGTLESLVSALTRQISSPVRWLDNMKAMISMQPERIVEIGPNKPLRKFFMELGQEISSIINLRSARRALLKGRKEAGGAPNFAGQ